MRKPIAWTIAGSDSSGGAGIQADLATYHDFAVHGCSVLTAITAQNSLSVTQIDYVSATMLTAQLQQLTDDMPAAAIKLGMLGELNALTQFLKNYAGWVVCDPVIYASSGCLLLQDIEQFKRHIMPQVDILTPNIYEAEQLSGIRIRNYADMQVAANCLLQMGVQAVYLKGGHTTDKQFSQDYFTDGEQSFWLSHVRIDTIHTHGTGCTFSAALAAALALDYALPDALVIAKMYVHQGIRLATASGAGRGCVAHQGFPQSSIDLPYLTATPLLTKPIAFASCGPQMLGLYPVVDSYAWVAKLVKLGVTTIQLRIKNPTTQLAEIIHQSIQLAQQYQCRLFINDHWQLAIKYGAYGVHLGQTDLEHVDHKVILQAGLRLGISTHCFYEVARAHALNPSYVACGPIFPTTSKIMPFVPQGLARLAYWCRVVPYPVVAIGGIYLEQIAAVRNAGADGVAMISAITQAENLEQTLVSMKNCFL